MTGRVALVTGSTSGIGLGIAEALAAEGADLVLNGFGEAAAIAALQARLRERYRIRCVHQPANLAAPREIAAMIRSVLGEFGSLDILVNNAGIQHVAPIEEFPAEKWDAVLAVNLSSSFHTIQAALPSMREKGWGRIINIASAHGLVASANKVAYVAAKHGLLGLTKVVALETAQSAITCNAICPGWVLTPLVQQQIDARAQAAGKPAQEARRELLAEKQPSLEFVTPEQLGALAVFLCSPAGAQIRGAAYSVDGGWVAQ
jgi:3-hydroxybutyrate dehydrogenase